MKEIWKPSTRKKRHHADEELRWNARTRHAYTRRAVLDHDFTPKDVLIIADRGCRGRFPENSLPAIAACAEEGAQIAEVDVDLTADGHAVLLHDRAPDRVANVPHWKNRGIQPVSAMPLKKVQALWLAQSDQTGATTPYKIPTLRSALLVAKACGIHLLLRPKKRPGLGAAIARAAHETGTDDHIILMGVDSLTSFLDYSNSSNTTLAQRRLLRRSSVPETDTKTTIFASTAHRGNIQTACTRIECTRRTVDATDAATNSTSQRLDLAGWVPTTGGRLKYGWHRTQRDRGIGTVVSFLADEGEFYLRDPDRIKDIWPNATLDTSTANLLSTICGTNDTKHPGKHEVFCLGARLWLPTLQATRARFAVTDMPVALRAALLAVGIHAPGWPLDPPNLGSDGAQLFAGTLSHGGPKCLDLANLPT